MFRGGYTNRSTTESNSNLLCLSAHIYGIYSRNIGDIEYGKQLYDVETGRRKVQRIFCGYNFYSIVPSCFYYTMMHAGTLWKGDVRSTKYGLLKILVK